MISKSLDVFGWYYDSGREIYVITKNGEYFLACTGTQAEAENIVKLLQKDIEKEEH